ncbi:class I SAM-dependent methyltransferase [Chitinophagales bacterium]|nr:class I SAM-dependent methyltransferase [Chitinophagales bacterium]|tara:strand:- start:43425 stop:44303 length:879 start_codon:yes stop_codon:yes gene_type:complete
MKACLVCKKTNFETVVNSKDFCVSHEDFKVVRCTNCGFGFTENAPDVSKIGEYYEHTDYVSHTDTKEGLFFNIYHKVRSFMLGQKRAYINKHTAVNNILDIGAGTGYFVNHMQSHGTAVTGFEPDNDARAQAKKNFGIELEPSLEGILGRNEVFDAISMWHVLEHVHDLKEYFGHFQQLIKTRGVLAIAVPNYSSFDGRFYKKFWAAYDLPKHLWHFSPDSIKLLAQSNGFDHLQSYAMPFDPFYIALLSEGHKQSGGGGKIRALFIGMTSFLKGFFNPEKASSVVYVFRKR